MPRKLTHSYCFIPVLAAAVIFLGIFPNCNTQTTESNPGESESNDSDVGDPWETPLQELQRITNMCSHKMPGFEIKALKAQQSWQACIDSLSPASVLKSRSSMRVELLNESAIYEINKQIYTAVCSNTTAYKSCWSSVLIALNECQPGTGDVAGTLYYALYDDICRDGGLIAAENRSKAATAGKLCRRDYATETCVNNMDQRRANDVCIRFKANSDCDLSSIDPQCSNEIDKRLHTEIFERVVKVLKCSTADMHRGSSACRCRCDGCVLLAFLFFGLYKIANYISK